MNEDNDLEDIIGFDALYRSMFKCRRGVMWKDSVANYYLNGIKETLKLEHQLKTNTYVPRAPQKIQITYPKKREAVCIAFRDRVYQRSLNDNALYPLMTKSLIHHNIACQKGKGTDMARNELDKFLRKAYQKWDLDVYVLQCDIKNYYGSMDHDKVEAMFRKYLPERYYKLTEDILRGQYREECGYNPGSQMIQIAGISFPNDLDHFIKEKLHIKFFLRYMDDFILIHHSLKYLKHCRERIAKFLAKKGLKLHPVKTRIFEVTKGIDFLGFQHRLTTSGKVIRTILSPNVKSRRRKLVKMSHLVFKGKLSKSKVDECQYSWVNGHAIKGNTYKVRQRMSKFYNDLWKDTYYGNKEIENVYT